MKYNTKSGKYKLKNPQKYIGNKDKIFFRSSLELRMMNYLDNSKLIDKWSSEEVVIPYRSPINNKIRNYYIDFFVYINNRKILIEVKPYKFTKPPKNQRVKSYPRQLKEFLNNCSKWTFAKNYAKMNECDFQILTENHLNNLNDFFQTYL